MPRDRAEDAGDGKIVIFARGGGAGIADKLPLCRLRGSEVLAHRHERLALLVPLRVDDALLGRNQRADRGTRGAKLRLGFRDGSVLRAADKGERGGKRKGGERFHGVHLEEAGSGLCDTSRMHGHGEGHQNARAEDD